MLIFSQLKAQEITLLPLKKTQKKYSISMSTGYKAALPHIS